MCYGSGKDMCLAAQGGIPLPFPDQDFPPFQEKQGKITTLARNFGIKLGSKYIPCQTVGSANNTLPRQKL